MEWVDVTKEVVAEDVNFTPGVGGVLYSHKYGPLLNLIDDKKVVALSGMKSGNYKAEIEYVKGSDSMTIRFFIREPAEIFKR